MGFYYSNGKNGPARRCKACKQAETARYIKRRSERRRRRRLGLQPLGKAPKPRRVYQRTGTGKPPISAASSDLILELYARAETLPHWERLTLYKRAEAIAEAIAEGGDE